MSMKKKFASKLANGVRQVKLQREQVSAISATPTPTPTKIAPVVKPVAKPAPVSVATKPVALRTAQRLVTNSDRLHPRRVWPD